MNGYGPAFASTNPAVAQLFANIFTTQRAADASAQATAAQNTARAQIDAQERLAQAQLESAARQNEYNRLFREKELTSRESAEAERNRLFGRQLDISEKSTRPTIDAERRKADIAATNAAAKTAATRFQDLYDSTLDAKVTEAKKNAHHGLFSLYGHLPGLDTNEQIDAAFDNPQDDRRKKLEDDAWKETLRTLNADRSGASQLVLPDSRSRKFLPALLDENGNLLGTAGTTTSSASNPAALGAGVAPTLSKADTGGGGFKLDISPLAGLFKAPWVPATTGTYTSAATGSIPSPSAMTVRRPLGDRTVLLAPEDDATLARQLVAVPTEQRPAAYANMVEQLLKSGRARLVPVGGFVPPGSTNYVLPDYNAFQ